MDASERTRLEIAAQSREASRQAVAAYLLTQGLRSAAEWKDRERAARAAVERSSLCYLVRNSEGAGYDPERQLLEPVRSRVLWEEQAEL